LVLVGDLELRETVPLLTQLPLLAAALENTQLAHQMVALVAEVQGMTLVLLAQAQQAKEVMVVRVRVVVMMRQAGAGAAQVRLGAARRQAAEVRVVGTAVLALLGLTERLMPEAAAAALVVILLLLAAVVGPGAGVEVSRSTAIMPLRAPQTVEAVVADAILAGLVTEGAQASSSFATLAHSAVPVEPSHPLAATPTTRLTHLGRTQHEPLCTNRRKQCRPASAGHRASRN